MLLCSSLFLGDRKRKQGTYIKNFYFDEIFVGVCQENATKWRGREFKSLMVNEMKFKTGILSIKAAKKKYKNLIQKKNDSFHEKVIVIILFTIFKIFYCKVADIFSEWLLMHLSHFLLNFL